MNNDTFIRRFLGTVNDYEKVRGSAPKYVAMSREFYEKYCRSVNSNRVGVYDDNLGRPVYLLYGIKVRFVRRQNYMEAMPRRPKLRRAKGTSFLKWYAEQTWPKDPSDLVFPPSLLDKATQQG